MVLMIDSSVHHYSNNTIQLSCASRITVNSMEIISKQHTFGAERGVLVNNRIFVEYSVENCFTPFKIVINFSSNIFYICILKLPVIIFVVIYFDIQNTDRQEI